MNSAREPESRKKLNRIQKNLTEKITRNGILKNSLFEVQSLTCKRGIVVLYSACVMIDE